MMEHNVKQNDNILECKEIKKSFPMGATRLEVLKGASIALASGEWLMLLGASGSGKTTLLNILGALETPDSGELRFNGAPYRDLDPAKLRNGKIGFVFQSYHLLPELSVLENVMLPAMLAGNFGERRRAEELLAKVGLKDRLKHRPNELSGGECQRAAIARSLMNSPELLLADEPTGNLDAKNGEGIMELFAGLHAASCVSIIMITHNPRLAKFSDRALELVDGKVRRYEA